jgi:CxxC-x17-CxxC domain-containing protein
VSGEDRTLVCRACGVEFVFTAGEQAFYRERAFAHEPRRCKECRNARQAAAAVRPAAPRRGADAVCSACGAATKLAFVPDGVRPVYCRRCFQARRR